LNDNFCMRAAIELYFCQGTTDKKV
jgi:hypothetical protein